MVNVNALVSHLDGDFMDVLVGDMAEDNAHVNPAHIAGGIRGLHNLHSGLPDRCDSYTACRMCRLEQSLTQTYIIPQYPKAQIPTSTTSATQ